MKILLISGGIYLILQPFLLGWLANKFKSDTLEIVSAISLWGIAGGIMCFGYVIVN